MKEDSNPKASGSSTEECDGTAETCSDERARSSEEDNDRRILETVLELANKRHTPSKLYSINWDQVAENMGDGFEAGDIHKRFNTLTSKVRKRRTMVEITSDALAILGQPSKPPGAYVLYVKKMRKRYPDVPSKELFKLVSNKWKDLKESKKKRYIEKGQKLMEEYKIQLSEWKRNNSQTDITEIQNSASGEQKHRKGKNQKRKKLMLDSNSTVVANDPQCMDGVTKEKIMSPFEVYSEVKRPSLAQKHPSLSPQSLTAKLNRKWTRLSEAKKEKYALKSKEYKTVAKTTLSGYSVFCRNKRTKVKMENPDLSPRDITKTLGAMWRALNQNEKDHYNALARE